jgi:hypothetical protein
MCNKHYLRFVRSTPKAERSPVVRQTDEERFFSFVNKMGPIARNRPDLGRCWVWTGGETRGYGIFWADGTSHRAHVWSYKRFVGEVPEGLELDHFACDRTNCVNYQHVQPATHYINALRSTSPMAQNSQKLKCKNGHDFDESNTRINAAGARECKKCVRKKQREAKAAKREAAGAKPRMAPDATHCDRGHEMTPENTITYKSTGTRICRTCRSEDAKAEYAAREAADTATLF